MHIRTVIISPIDTRRTRYSPIKLGRVNARDSALNGRVSTTAAVWAAMKAKTKIGMKPKNSTTRKNTTKKRILPTVKRGVTFSANVERARVDWRRGQRNESDK